MSASTPASDPPAARGGYRAGGRGRWPAVALVAAVHALLFGVLVAAGPGRPPPRVRPAPLVVSFLTLTPPAPAPRPKPPAQVASPPRAVPVAPVPEVRVPAPPDRPVAIAVAQAPPRPVVVAPPTAPAPPAGPVAGGDLSTRLLSAQPPRYPVESRRRREQGTVVLDVLVDERGLVAAVAVAASSGHARLDRAARDAVRDWRWSPLLRAGTAVAVRGRVRIPFALVAQS